MLIQVALTFRIFTVRAGALAQGNKSQVPAFSQVFLLDLRPTDQVFTKTRRWVAPTWSWRVLAFGFLDSAGGHAGNSREGRGSRSWGTRRGQARDGRPASTLAGFQGRQRLVQAPGPAASGKR